MHGTGRVNIRNATQIWSPVFFTHSTSDYHKWFLDEEKVGLIFWSWDLTIFSKMLWKPLAYLEPSRTSTMELFAKIVKHRFYLSSIKKVSSQMFDWVPNKPLLTCLETCNSNWRRYGPQNERDSDAIDIYRCFWGISIWKEWQFL